MLRRADGKLLCRLSTADCCRLEALGWVPPREFTALAADGETELWGTMYFPNGFDPKQTYPVIEHIYGGPQWTVAPHSYEPDWYAKAEAGAPSGSASYSQALAQFGFVVIMVDGRLHDHQWNVRPLHVHRRDQDVRGADPGRQVA